MQGHDSDQKTPLTRDPGSVAGTGQTLCELAMSSMQDRLLQRVTPDLRANDLLWLKTGLQKPGAMAADGLAFGESYRPPRRGRPPVGLRQCWLEDCRRAALWLEVWMAGASHTATYLDVHTRSN